MFRYGFLCLAALLAGCEPTPLTESPVPVGQEYAGTWRVSYNRLIGDPYACAITGEDVEVVHLQGKDPAAYYAGNLHNTRLRCSGPGLSAFDYLIATYTGNTTREFALWPAAAGPAEVFMEAVQLRDGTRQIGTINMRTDPTLQVRDTLRGHLRVSVSLEPYRPLGFVVEGQYELIRVQ